MMICSGICREIVMAAQVTNVSAEPQQRTRLMEMGWRDITEPGAYVEKGSGDLYRVPKEALLEGASPLIRKESNGASTLVQLSKNPFITTLEARMICCEHNVTPNF
jgi:hypothetical protein